MNLGDFRTAASIELGIDAENAGEKQRMVDRLANQSVLELLKRCDVRVATGTMDTIPGVGDYNLSQSILRIKTLLGPNSYGMEPLDRVSGEELLYSRDGNGSNGNGGIGCYALLGMNQLMLYPTPGNTYTLMLEYVPKPAKMTQPEHDPALTLYGGIPEEFHNALELWIYHKGASAGDDQGSQQGMSYMQMYVEELRSVRRAINRHGGRLGPADVRVSRRSRHRVWANDRA